jgi:hypothetical protein
MCSIHSYITSTAPAALDCDDIIRSSLVLAVGSFDLYMHDIFRTEVMHRLVSRREVVGLKIPFNASLLTPAEQALLIEECIRNDNSFRSFVAPGKLAECLRPLVETPWDKISEELGESSATCKASLKRVVDLRNRIAHEADVNPAYGGIELWPIYSQDVVDSVAFLRSLGIAIGQVISDT